MKALVDDLSRIIASPIPRRRALRLAGTMLGGGILAYFGLGRASRALARDHDNVIAMRSHAAGFAADRLRRAAAK